MEIFGRQVGINHRPIVIAEIGVSHGGYITKAREMVRAAIQSGCDAVKFQSHRMHEMDLSHPLREKIESYIIPDERLREVAEEEGAEWFSTPFSASAVEDLVAQGAGVMKVGSGEMSNMEILSEIALYPHLTVLLSSGMGSLNALKKSMRYLNEAGIDVIPMHCVSKYPTPVSAAGLGSLRYLLLECAGPIGYSDHCSSPLAAPIAVGLGASVIEKHFHGDAWVVESNCPDFEVAIGKQEMTELVKSCRNAWSMTFAQGPPPDLSEIRYWAEHCLYTSKAVSAGDSPSHLSVTTKRPGPVAPLDDGIIMADNYLDVTGGGWVFCVDLPKGTPLAYNMVKRLAC